MPWIVLIQHKLDQSRFPDDLKTNLLKEIARMDKPNVEFLLNMLRRYQKMQGSNGGHWSEAGINDGQKNKSQKGMGVCKCIMGCTENLPEWQFYVYRNRSFSEKLEVVQEYNHCLNCQECHSVESCTNE